MRTIILLFTGLILLCFSFCTQKTNEPTVIEENISDSVAVEREEIPDTVSAQDIVLEKELLYNEHTLEDEYPYKDTTRVFQWDKVKERLALLENIQREPASWSILQNYKNKNREAPLIRNYVRNTYKRVSDTLGVERYQSAPLYLTTDSVTPELYGRDGWLVKHTGEEGSFEKVRPVERKGEWLVPKRYIKHIHDSVIFTKAIIVDVSNQNIASVEKSGSKWMIRSMNPATTGVHNPPYAQETPTGIFVIQEHKPKMLYLKDGSSELAGYAPWASRFSNGGYIHGVPTNSPTGSIIEFSPTLGTIPRSHMCVRNASSHAKFIYDWAVPEETILFVID